MITIPIFNLNNIKAATNYMAAGTTTDTPTNLTVSATAVSHSVLTTYPSAQGLAAAKTLGIYVQANDPRSDNGFTSLALGNFSIVDLTQTTNNFICGTSNSVKTVTLGSAGGSGYAIGDILAITGGGGTGAQIKVLTINTGAVLTYQLIAAGSGYTTTSNLATTKITGAGNNAANVTITTTSANNGTVNVAAALPSQATFGTGYTFSSITCTTANAITLSDQISITGFTATNPTVAATNAITYLMDIQDNNTTVDEGFLAIPIITSNNIAVSMVVTPYITLGLSATTANLGTAAYNTVAGTVTPWIVLTTTTNAVSGEKVYVWDNNGNADTTGMAGGLYSSGASYTIHADSNTASTNLSTDMIHEHYDLNGGTAVSGLTVATPYSGNDNTSAGGFLKNYSTLFASSAGALANGSSTIKFFSTVSGTTPVGTYADTVTFTAAGNF